MSPRQPSSCLQVRDKWHEFEGQRPLTMMINQCRSENSISTDFSLAGPTCTDETTNHTGLIANICSKHQRGFCHSTFLRLGSLGLCYAVLCLRDGTLQVRPNCVASVIHKHLAAAFIIWSCWNWQLCRAGGMVVQTVATNVHKCLCSHPADSSEVVQSCLQNLRSPTNRCIVCDGVRRNLLVRHHEQHPQPQWPKLGLLQHTNDLGDRENHAQLNCWIKRHNSVPKCPESYLTETYWNTFSHLPTKDRVEMYYVRRAAYICHALQYLQSLWPIVAFLTCTCGSAEANLKCQLWRRKLQGFQTLNPHTMSWLWSLLTFPELLTLLTHCTSRHASTSISCNWMVSKVILLDILCSFIWA